MYAILINNYEKGEQYEYSRHTQYSSAEEDCVFAAKRFVLDKEGKRYLDTKVFFDKNEVKKKGYFLTRKELPFGVRITIFYKEPNGIVITGAIRKIRQYYTAFIKTKAVPREDNRTYHEKCLAQMLEYHMDRKLNEELEISIKECDDEIIACENYDENLESDNKVTVNVEDIFN